MITLAANSAAARLAGGRGAPASGGTRVLLAGLLAAALLVLAAAGPSEAAFAQEPRLRSLGGGGWCWFADPRAIHHRGQHNRTYVGWLDRDGAVKVASYDHTSDRRTTAVLRWELGVDDHNNPALHVRPDGRLVVFYSRHNGGDMYYRVSRRPEDVTAWGPERTIPTNTIKPSTGSDRGYTYPNPVQLAREGRMYLFWRGGSAWPTFATSRDGGGTWTKAKNWVRYDRHRPYIKFASNDRDTIHFAFTQGHPSRINSNIYYAAYRGGRILNAGGRTIKTTRQLPLRPREADLVYDTSARAWIHDIADTGGGRPVIVFASIKGGRHRYHYARFTGGRWRVFPVTSAGPSIADNGHEPYYSGGITLDHENPSVVYLSRHTGGTFEVETWTTPDGGQSWRRSAVTSGSQTENVRPVSPRGLRSFGADMSVLWMRGSYEHYVRYKTDVYTLLMNGGNVPPHAEALVGPRQGRAPLAVRFMGGRSRDSDGSIVRWQWHFGDGTAAIGHTVNHTYTRPGRYFPRLTVTDDAGDSDTFVAEVIVR